jgi:hypothetical protein
MYNIGGTKQLSTRTTVDGETIFILKDMLVKDRVVEIPATRWLLLVLAEDDINEAVKQLNDNQQVKYCHHIGANWYVSVATGFRCVDLRRFYKKDDELRPTREGLALHLNEWTELRDLFPQLTIEALALHTAQPCFCGARHETSDV